MCTFKFQISDNFTNQSQSFSGFATIKFSKNSPRGSEHGKLNQGLKTGKCFVLYDNNISEIRGHLIDSELKVNVQNSKTHFIS